MIRIIDQTLYHIGAAATDTEALREFYALLFQCGADAVEVGEKVAARLRDVLDPKRTVLHLDYPHEAEGPFSRYVCHITDAPLSMPLICQVRVNDLRELPILAQYAHQKRLRIVGLNDLMLHDSRQAFDMLAETLPRTAVELCPTNEYGCAGAILTEWLSYAGGTGVTALMGAGGTAPFEQVMMALRLSRRHRPNADLSVLPRLRTLFEQLTGEHTPAHQPVLGRAIFEVESGVHVNGILKNAALYEPFPPESVGMRRKIVIGTQSGQSGLQYRLEQLGCPTVPERLPALLYAVQRQSAALRRALTDKELLQAARGEALPK